MLLEQPGRFPGIEELADRLHVTSRTLRRKLQAEGTSYASILASVRKDLAIQHLRTTRMKVDEIAEALGFSDVASFRQAFRKWTGRSPSDYRGRARASA
jgi:AraC-like DNA-binding protein